MKHILTLAVAILISVPAAAEIIEVPLESPEYVGKFAGPAFFDLDVGFNPYYVVDVRVRLAGANCGVYFNCGGGPYNWNHYRTGVSLSIALGVDVQAVALTEASQGFPACDEDPIPFDLEVSLPAPEGGWTVFTGENVQLLLDSPEGSFRSPVDNTRCSLVDDFHGLETLVLIIETDATVPSDATSWSTLKTRYR